MNVLLLLPIGLAAFATLLLPLLLHLARRSEVRIVPFAALRWLRAAPQPQRRHRLEEWLLLLLRLLLLAALALLLAQPVLFGRPDRRPRVAVAPGVDVATARDAVEVADARWQRLASGFPKIDTGAQAVPATATATDASLPSLLRELDATLPTGTPLTVVVPPVIDDADAQRPILSREVDWRVVGTAEPSLPNRADASARQSAARPPQVQVRFAPQREDAVRYLRAAGMAWLQDRPQPGDAAPAGDASDPAERRAARTPAAATNPVSVAPAAQPLDGTVGNLVWLVPGTVPDAVQAWVEDGGRVLLDSEAKWPGLGTDAPVVWRDETGTLARAVRHDRGRVIQLQRPWQPASMPSLLDPGFPAALRGLFADPPPPPRRVLAADHAPRSGAAPWPEQPRPLAPWLVWLVAGLFLLERWVASGPRPGERGRSGTA
jgi:hypothetical protein